MSENANNRSFSVAQCALICAFAAAILLERTHRLFDSTVARYIGDALCAIGLALFALAFVALREVIQVAPEPKLGGQLVTTGIYHRLRHPIYTAMIVLVVGLWLRKPTLYVTIAGAIFVAFLFVKTHYEERRLIARYPEYAEYRRQTWGLIPGL